MAAVDDYTMADALVLESADGGAPINFTRQIPDGMKQSADNPQVWGAAMRLVSFQRRLMLVSLHEPAVGHNISSQKARKAALHPCSQHGYWQTRDY